VIRVEYDWTATEPGTAVVETVATAPDREPQGLEPPSATVDSDALNTFIRTVESAANVEPFQTVQGADRVVTMQLAIGWRSDPSSEDPVTPRTDRNRRRRSACEAGPGGIDVETRAVRSAVGNRRSLGDSVQHGLDSLVGPIGDASLLVVRLYYAMLGELGEVGVGELDGEFVPPHRSVTGARFGLVQSVDEVAHPNLPLPAVAEVLEKLSTTSVRDEAETRVQISVLHDRVDAT